eukprot:915817-Rhodomonas_salina.2
MAGAWGVRRTHRKTAGPEERGGRGQSGRGQSGRSLRRRERHSWPRARHLDRPAPNQPPKENQMLRI